MRSLKFFCIFILGLPFLGACSLYQSDGREAIEKNSANIVTGTGLDSVLNVAFTCYQSGAEPEQTKGPVQVIDHEFESHGYASYLVDHLGGKKLLVHAIPRKGQAEHHHFCDLDTFGDFSHVKIHSAIRLGVQLLAE